jgi:hypothetical protein
LPLLFWFLEEEMWMPLLEVTCSLDLCLHLPDGAIGVHQE